MYEPVNLQVVDISVIVGVPDSGRVFQVVDISVMVGVPDSGRVFQS